MINIVIILDSLAHLKKCAEGLSTLAAYANRGDAKVAVHVRSLDQHTEKLELLLEKLSVESDTNVIIVGADKTMALAHFIDTYLRNHLWNTKIVVFGVVFTGENMIDNLSALLSANYGPSNQLAYTDQDGKGFSKACVMACTRTKYPVIKLTEIPPSLNLTLAQAIQMAGAT